MYARVETGVLYGLAAESASVEADLAPGLPGFFIVGLADLAVREAKERIRAALGNEGCRFPSRRITVNLAPAGIRKEGTHFDLPIAVSVLAAEGRIPAEALSGCAFLGELSLDGRVTRVDGVLPLLIGLQQKKITRIFLPQDNLEEGLLLKDLMLYPVSRLGQVLEHFRGEQSIEPRRASGKSTVKREGRPVAAALDFADVAGQESVKQIVTAAAAASHGLLLVGPPGVGKTMICRRVAGILPPLTYEEQLEVTKIYSVAGKLTESQPIIVERPFRAPHHSLTAAALAGGGARPCPGEISLAHRGVLFLDEPPQFQGKILELLRTPLEDGAVTISRIGGDVTFPADFMLVAAMNPCKCGYFGDENHSCTCTEAQLQAYQSRLSGPLLDRIDIRVEMSPSACLPGAAEQMKEQMAEQGTSRKRRPLTSADMRTQVEEARKIQRERYRRENILYNSELTSGLIKKYCTLSVPSRELLRAAYSHYHLSARAGDKVLRLARTIADLSGCRTIGEEHLAEALRYRCTEKIYRGRS